MPKSFVAVQLTLAHGEAFARRFTARVYGWMVAGLVTTAAVAHAVGRSEAVLGAITGSRLLFYGLLAAELGLVLVLAGPSARSTSRSAALFLIYSAMNGLTMAVVFARVNTGSVALAFVVAAGAFGAMSVFGATTRRDVSSWHTFLVMGLSGIIIAIVTNLVLHSSLLSFLVSCMSVVVFSGFAAFHARLIREIGRSGDSSTSTIACALALYLDFVNLFLAVLQLASDREA
jgi:FtsH-binding integral membrane protein